MSGFDIDARIDIAALKDKVILAANGINNWKKYWGALRQFVQGVMAKDEFDGVVVAALGAENVGLHNTLVNAIMTNAYSKHVPPVCVAIGPVLAKAFDDERQVQLKSQEKALAAAIKDQEELDRLREEQLKQKFAERSNRQKNAAIVSKKDEEEKAKREAEDKARRERKRLEKQARQLQLERDRLKAEAENAQNARGAGSGLTFKFNMNKIRASGQESNDFEGGAGAGGDGFDRPGGAPGRPGEERGHSGYGPGGAIGGVAGGVDGEKKKKKRKDRGEGGANMRPGGGAGGERRRSGMGADRDGMVGGGKRPSCILPGQHGPSSGPSAQLSLPKAHTIPFFTPQLATMPWHRKVVPTCLTLRPSVLANYKPKPATGILPSQNGFVLVGGLRVHGPGGTMASGGGGGGGGGAGAGGQAGQHTGMVGGMPAGMNAGGQRMAGGAAAAAHAVAALNKAHSMVSAQAAAAAQANRNGGQAPKRSAVDMNAANAAGNPAGGEHKRLKVAVTGGGGNPVAGVSPSVGALPGLGSPSLGGVLAAGLLPKVAGGAGSPTLGQVAAALGHVVAGSGGAAAVGGQSSSIIHRAVALGNSPPGTTVPAMPAGLSPASAAAAAAAGGRMGLPKPGSLPPK